MNLKLCLSAGPIVICLLSLATFTSGIAMQHERRKRLLLQRLPAPSVLTAGGRQASEGRVRVRIMAGSGERRSSPSAWHLPATHGRVSNMKKKAAPKKQPRDVNQRAKSIVDQATRAKPPEKSPRK